MRKHIVLLSLLVFVAIYGLAQNVNKYYYYYKGEKQFLELNTDFVFVSVEEDKTKKTNLFSVNEGTLKKEGLSDKMKQKLNSSNDFYWAEIKLGKNTANAVYDEKVVALKQIVNVQIVSPYFKSAHSKKIGLTNFFYVKLKETSDVTLLEQYAKQTKSIIVKQDDFMPLWYVLSCTKSSNKNAMELANQFFESGLFQYAEPDLMLEDILNCVNDTYFPQQWGLRNTGQYGGTEGIDIRACDAWNISTGANVNVAVIDEGIQLNHPDLQTNIHSLSYDGENGTSPSIVRGHHGTACAGIVGAVGNTAGISGVAPNCRLISVSNIMETTTPNIKQKLASSINWAVQNGAHVLSNSWGHNDLASSYIDNAITNAITNGRNGLGCIVVFSTGNNNGAVLYPANSNPNILAVGAISECGQQKSPTSCDGESWGSNFGTTLDVVAPGVLIPTTDRTGTDGYNTNLAIHPLNGGTRITTDYTNNDYTVWFNGTSSACPHIAGVAALILSVNPSLTGQQVRDIIEQTAQKVGGYNYATTTGRTNGTWHNEMGYGLVNALCAVTRAQMSLATISGPSTVCSGTTFSITNPPPYDSITWEASTNLQIINGQDPTQITVNRISGGNATISAVITGTCGDPITLTRTFNPFISVLNEYDYQNCNNISVTATASPGASVVWETTNGLLINGMSSPRSGIGNTVTISSPYGADGEVTARNCFETSTIYFNPCVYWDANLQFVNSSSPGNPMQGEPITAQADPCYDTNSYRWYIDGQYIGKTDEPELTTYDWLCDEHQLQVQAVTADRVTDLWQNSIDYWGLCGYFMALSPNPASDYVEVSISTESTKTSQALNDTYTVRVLNIYGFQVYHSKKAGSKFNIPVSNLKEGIYIVEVSNGKKVARKQLIVKND